MSQVERKRGNVKFADGPTLRIEECVDIFDRCRRTFEYVFGTMRIEAERAKEFVKELSALPQKKPRA